jgi:proline dehydrogenase
VGICLQAYLKRTERDLKLLGAHKSPIRMVKGFYNDRDFNTWEEVTQNYFRLLPILLTQSSYPAIATHDEKIINEAKKIIREKNITNAEFQFFLGVRDDLVQQLVKEGFRVRVYIPYGNFWRFLLKGLRTFDILHGLERLFGLRPR